MTERVYRFIQENRMLEAGQKVLLGVSGGADSTCLLCLLQELAPRLLVTLEVLHVHHGIRGGEADRDARWTEELCRSLGVPFHLKKADVPALAAQWHMSLETAGRRVRYEALEELAREIGADRIAVAHHKSDQAETLLMNLFRGSGLEGLAGIPAHRGTVVRPLLCLSRGEIEAYLAERGQDYCTDATNTEDDATRNKLRNRVLPYVSREINPAVEENLLRTARILQEASAYFKKEGERALKACLLQKEKTGIPGARLRLNAAAAACEEDIILMYMLRRAVEECKGDVKDLEETHLRSLARLARERGDRRIDLPGGLRAYREGEELLLSLGEPEKEEEIPLLSLEMCVFPYDCTKKIPENTYTKWFDYDKIKESVTVRHRQEGDYFALAPSGTKTLHRFFIDQKVPRKERDACTLVADGSHILWIVGYRISEAYKVTPDTGRVLEIKVVGAEASEQQTLFKEENHGREN